MYSQTMENQSAYSVSPTDYLHRYGEEKDKEEINFPNFVLGLVIGLFIMILLDIKKKK